jgi:chemotaxis protein CheX
VESEETRVEATQAAELVRNAVTAVFGTMLGSELRPGDPVDDPEPFLPAEVVSLIGLSGAVNGYLSLQCTREHARDLTARLLGADGHDVESLDEIRDAVGELVNMIAGKVKTAMACEQPVEIGLPTVVTTPKTDIKVRATFGVAVPFEDHFGEFFVEFVLSGDSWQG